MYINNNVRKTMTRIAKKYDFTYRNASEFIVKCNFQKISKNGDITKSKSFLRFFKSEIDWEDFFYFNKLQDNIIKEFHIFADCETVLRSQELSEEFLEENYNRYNYHMWRHATLSENFLRKHAADCDWYEIAQCQILSENFIRDFADKIDWYCVSYHQVLSEKFIREFADKVDWQAIYLVQDISGELIEEYVDKIGIYKAIFPDGHEEELCLGNMHLAIDEELDTDFLNYSNEDMVVAEISEDTKTIWLEPKAKKIIKYGIRIDRDRDLEEEINDVFDLVDVPF